MADICAWCKSQDTMGGLDLLQCLACGQHSTFDGKKAVPTSVSNEGGTVKSVEKELT